MYQTYCLQFCDILVYLPPKRNDIMNYSQRRSELIRRMKEKRQDGIIVFIGNAEAPAQYKQNGYKWRQDSTWLYYFGIDEPLYAAVIDLDNGDQTIFADDTDIDDIMWTGPMPSVAEVASTAGISKTESYAKIDLIVSEAIIKGRKIHSINPSRYFNTMRLRDLGIDKPSEPLSRAIIEMRLVKTPEEIQIIDEACTLGQEMHTIARKGIRVGRIEQEIVGEMEGFALAKGWGTSFPTILTQHGEIFHNHSHDRAIEDGKLMVVDAGVEHNKHYASDFTRTYPTGGRFTAQQKDIYSIVYECNEMAFKLTAPGTAYRDIHMAVYRKMLEDLSTVGLVHGSIDAMMDLGVAGLFMPHGLGHNMGLDVHDMEDLCEDWVGYDPDQSRSELLGLHSLRMARKLVPGNVVTDEPGIYFIPLLIESWKNKGIASDFINYSKLEAYYDFGGIRLEDDVLVTSDGARRLGANRLPIAPEDVEKAMEND